MKLIHLAVCILFTVSCTQQNKTSIQMEEYINKQIVIDFYKKAIGKQDLDYAAKSVTDDYIQHNPQVKTGKDGFLEAIQFLKTIPKSKNPPQPFMRIIADDDYVVIHLSVEFGGQKKIVLDLFRLENGLIAEHWDAIQDTSEMSVNGHSEIEGPVLIENIAATDQNKKIVETFTKQVLINGHYDLFTHYVDENLIQHHSKIKNGIQGLIDYHQKIQFQKLYKVIGEGNFVTTQSMGIMNNKEVVHYDIYRLNHGKIVEHWIVSQSIPKIMTHTNGMI